MPVVAPRAGGAADVVRHLETGLLYDPAHRARAGPTPSTRSPRTGSRALLGERARAVATRCWRDAVDELVEHHYRPLVAAATLTGR